MEEAISEMDLYDVPDDILESDEDFQIVISGWWVHIPELGLALHEGVFCNYDKEKQAYFPDFAVTVVKQASEKETKEGDWLYYEPDDFAITLANYLHGKMDLGYLEQLLCVIHMPQKSMSTKE